MRRPLIHHYTLALGGLFLANFVPAFAAIAPAAPDGAYLKSYNLRFTAALRESGLNLAAHSISSRPDQAGRINLQVEVRLGETLQNLDLTYTGGPAWLHLRSAQLDHEVIAPPHSASRAQLDFWHVVASRGPGLKPANVSLVPDDANGLRTADLLVLPIPTSSRSGSPPNFASNELVLNEGQFYPADASPLMALGTGTEAEFRQLATHHAFEQTGSEFLVALTELGLASTDAVFSNAPQLVEVGRLFAMRDALPYRTTAPRVSALIYVRAIQSNGAVDLAIARAPVDLAELEWVPAVSLVE